ncbi:hypothetical protein PQI66_06510 [Corynebacterium sp. USCH3]|uniref:hypothetical protein n=1 Tax=Corynebacterium sp. USCH3 TaxID=3024840 RepID=UPI0030B5E44E
MGRLVIVVLVIVTVIVLWKAFGPKTWNTTSRGSQNTQFPSLGRQKPRQSTTKGPDDDPDFLWNIKKERFKAQREAERREQEAVERARRGEHWKPDDAQAASGGSSSGTTDAGPSSSPDSPSDQEKKPGNGGRPGPEKKQDKKKDGEGGA